MDEFILIMLLATVFVYLLIPLIIGALLKHPVSKTKSIFIVVINAIIWFLIFNILRALTTSTYVPNAAPVLIWSTISYSIFRKKYTIMDFANKKQEPSTEIDDIKDNDIERVILPIKANTKIANNRKTPYRIYIAIATIAIFFLSFALWNQHVTIQELKYSIEMADEAIGKLTTRLNGYEDKITNLVKSSEDEFVYIYMSGERYHRISCIFLIEEETLKLPLYEAIRWGFTSCTKCKPPTIGID